MDGAHDHESSTIDRWIQAERSTGCREPGAELAPPARGVIARVGADPPARRSRFVR